LVPLCPHASVQLRLHRSHRHLQAPFVVVHPLKPAKHSIAPDQSSSGAHRSSGFSRMRVYWKAERTRTQLGN
jgi:hypothetical protein